METSLWDLTVMFLQSIWLKFTRFRLFAAFGHYPLECSSSFYSASCFFFFFRVFSTFLLVSGCKSFVGKRRWTTLCIMRFICKINILHGLLFSLWRGVATTKTAVVFSVGVFAFHFFPFQRWMTLSWFAKLFDFYQRMESGELKMESKKLGWRRKSVRLLVSRMSGNSCTKLSFFQGSLWKQIEIKIKREREKRNGWLIIGCLSYLCFSIYIYVCVSERQRDNGFRVGIFQRSWKQLRMFVISALAIVQAVWFSWRVNDSYNIFQRLKHSKHTIVIEVCSRWIAPNNSNFCLFWFYCVEIQRLKGSLLMFVLGKERTLDTVKCVWCKDGWLNTTT